jgi:hypothetical protein
VGRTGLRIGVDSKGRKYFSIGLPGTGLSYRAFFDEPVTRRTLKGIALILVATLCVGLVIFLVARAN